MTHRAIRFSDGNNIEPDAPVWSGWYLSGNLAGIDVLVTFDTWVDIARYDFSIVEQSRPFGDETVPLLIQIVDCCFYEVDARCTDKVHCIPHTVGCAYWRA